MLVLRDVQGPLSMELMGDPVAIEDGATSTSVVDSALSLNAGTCQHPVSTLSALSDLNLHVSTHAGKLINASPWVSWATTVC